jgi:hypothetical protein
MAGEIEADTGYLMNAGSLRWVLADSEVGRLEAQPDALLVHLSAACLVLDGVEGDRAERWGYGRGLQCRLAEAVVVQGLSPGSRLNDVMGRIRHGEIWLDRQRHTGLPIPGTWQGDIHLTLTVGQYDILELRGQGLSVDFGDQAPNFTESLAC